MNISKRREPVLKILIIFNFVCYLILKLLLINNIITNLYIVYIYLILILLGLFTGVIYSLISICFTNKIENKVISSSKYLKSFDCYIFSGYDTSYFFRLKNDIYSIYINEKYLTNFNNISDVFNIREKFFMLKFMDKFYIYLNKYITTIYFSVFLFIVLQIFSNISINIIFQLLATIILYLLVNKFTLKTIDKTIEKRNLKDL